MSERTVYAVTSGCYSDYGVDALFERKEDAEVVIAEECNTDGYGGMNPDVAELVIYDGKPEKRTWYEASIVFSGVPDVLPEVDVRVHSDWPWDCWQVKRKAHKSPDANFRGTIGFYVYKYDRDHAVKSVADRARAWIAEVSTVNA